MKNVVLGLLTLLLVGSCCSLLPDAINHELNHQPITSPDVDREIVMSWLER